mmetsp:Transcript_112207/g.198763  ORF Transcript_112207/g.198763 Transcript_112207/m.198763 type:complete len:381 (-) Transcript_112207:65-1207(-)
MLQRSVVLLCIHFTLLWRGGSRRKVDCDALHDATLSVSLLQQGRQKVRETLAFDEAQDVKSSGPLVDVTGVSRLMERAAPEVRKLMRVHRAAKVLRSMYDKTTLFYHVHIPRTGGTTTANLLMADICSPESESMEAAGWNESCGKTCEMGLTDNELSCYDSGRSMLEHSQFAFSLLRAEQLRLDSGAKKVVFVTTLRLGSARVISHWAKEVMMRTFVVSPERLSGEEHGEFSNESLRAFINGSKHTLQYDWIASGNYLARNNLQVATLSSVDWDSLTPVTRQHLEQAKKTLLTGNWIIGFTGCLDELHQKLMEYARKLHGSVKPKVLPHMEPGSYHEFLPEISPEVMEEVNEAAALDNELSMWAWNLAKRGADDRFASTC